MEISNDANASTNANANANVDPDGGGDDIVTISDDGTTCNNSAASREDRIVESIYQHMMNSICRDVAMNMHELIKTGSHGVIPSSWQLFSRTTVPTRRELYPELYNNNKNENDTNNSNNNGKETTDEEIQTNLEKYAVDLPSMKKKNIPSKRRPYNRERDTLFEEEEVVPTMKKSKYKDSDDEDDNTNEDENDEGDDDDDEV